jgi:hypothetical protein
MSATAATAKFHDCISVLAEEPGHDSAEHRREFLRLQNVVDNNLDGPRLENIRECFAQHGHQRDGQRLPMRPQQVDDPQSSRGLGLQRFLEPDRASLITV